MNHSTGSHIMWMMEEFQLWFEEQAGDSKHPQSLVFDHFMAPKFGEVFTRVQMDSDVPVLLRTEMTLVSGTSKYVLPPNVHEVWQLVLLDDDGNIKAEARPNNYMHSCGPNWRIQGNVLVFEPALDANHTAHLIYAPGADNSMHYSTTGQVVDSTTFRLGDPVANGVGRVDFRENAYAGMMLRVLKSGAVFEERLIQTYDADTGDVTVDIALDTEAGTGIAYEVVVPGTVAFYEAVVLAAAMKFGAMRGVSQKNYLLMQAEYQSSIKTAMDTLGNLNVRISKHFTQNTNDSEGNRNFLVPVIPHYIEGS